MVTTKLYSVNFINTVELNSEANKRTFLVVSDLELDHRGVIWQAALRIIQIKAEDLAAPTISIHSILAGSTAVKIYTANTHKAYKPPPYAKWLHMPVPYLFDTATIKHTTFVNRNEMSDKMVADLWQLIDPDNDRIFIGGHALSSDVNVSCLV